MVGTQRSGSNLLRLLLGSLEGVSAPPSAHELRDFKEIEAAYEPLSNRQNKVRLVSDLRGLLGENALAWPDILAADERIAERMRGDRLIYAVAAIYETLSAESGASVWVSKCLENVHYPHDLLAPELDLRFLHLVRDPRDVAASFRNAPIGPKDPRAIGLAWLHDQLAAQRLQSSVEPSRWLRVRYEDLVGDTRQLVFRQLGGFLEVDWSDSALQFHESLEARSAPQLSTLWRNLDRPISSINVGRFRNVADQNFVSSVESVVYGSMVDYGYEPIYASESLAIDGELLAEIRESDRVLRSRFATGLDKQGEAIHIRRDNYLSALKKRLLN